MPDIKVFDDLELYSNDEQAERVEKPRKLKRNDRQLNSLRNISKSQGGPQMRSRGNLGKTNHGWKMDEIFLGFEDDGESFDEKKTVKINKL